MSKFKPQDVIWVMNFLMNDERVNAVGKFIREQYGGPYDGWYLVEINTVRIHQPKEKVLSEEEFRVKQKELRDLKGDNKT